MGTHITIFELIAITAVIIIGYAVVRAFYETFVNNSK